MKHALVLCTGNSARSILCEGLLRTYGPPRITGFSAGSKPTGAPNPLALATLKRNHIDPSFAASKSWDIFGRSDGPKMHYIITVCDSAAAEQCPLWPGHPAQAHWGLPDPAAVTGTDQEKMAAFEMTFRALKKRVKAFLDLPLDTSEPSELLEQVRAIGSIDA